MPLGIFEWGNDIIELLFFKKIIIVVVAILPVFRMDYKVE